MFGWVRMIVKCMGTNWNGKTFVGTQQNWVQRLLLPCHSGGILARCHRRTKIFHTRQP